MIPTITAFESSPDRGKGQARDMRVRWALEEVGQPYDVRLVSFSEMKQPAHRALHPFGQIPTYEEGDLALFESGAIVFHIAQRHAGLLPDDANARARAITWMFAALSTVEPPIVEFGTARLFESDKPWYAQRMPSSRNRVRDRLGELSRRLGNADWLDGAFSAGDLLMVTVLRRLNASDILNEYPNLSAYVARGEARPAFKRAFDAQLAVFTRRRSRRMGGANGSRECAPDDRLRDTHQSSSLMDGDGFRCALPILQAVRYAGTRPPKNGISAWLSVCGRFEVKTISAPAVSDSRPGPPSRSETRRAIAGAGSIQSTGHGASFTRRSSNSG